MARTLDIEKRRTLAREALEHVRACGTARVTMSSLAKVLGVKRPTLYWYFPDVASIFDAALEQMLAELDAFVEVEIRGITHPIDILYAHLCAVHRFYHGHEQDILVMFQFWAKGEPEKPERALARLGSRYLPRRTQAIELLKHGMAAGFVAPCDPEALITLVGALTDGLLIQRIVAKPALDKVHQLIWTQWLQPLRLVPQTHDASDSTSRVAPSAALCPEDGDRSCHTWIS